MYEFNHFDSPIHRPHWIVRLEGDLIENRHGRITNYQNTSSSLMDCDQDPKLFLTLLSYVDPDCEYDIWLRMLLVLFNSFEGNEIGLELAENWSVKGKKHKAGEVQKKWRSFG